MNPRYTPTDDARIEAMVNRGASDKEIAAALGRSPAGIMMRRHRLQLWTGDRGRFTKRDDTVLRAMFQDGHPDGEIAKRLKRSHGSIRERRRRLGLLRTGRTKKQCLRCHQQFLSEGVGNRLCVGCRRKASRYSHDIVGVSL